MSHDNLESKPSQNCWIAVERAEITFISIHINANQNSYHDEKSILHTFNTRSLSPTTQKSADSSTFWQFFYYRPPGKFRQRSLKISCQEPDIYRYYRYKQFDNRYGFSISIGNTNFYPSALRAGGVLSSRSGRAVGRAAARLAEPISL